MPYNVILSPKAEAFLAARDPLVRGEIAIQLHRLAESPTTLSRRSRIPGELPGYQVYEFEFPEAGVDYRYRVFFRYEQNEADLYVYIIGRYPFAAGAGADG